MKHFVSQFPIYIIGGALLIFPINSDAAKNRNTHKPNIVVIMADGIGYGDLSVTGATDVQTPNIDQLFYDGVIFTEFYSNSAVGSPTYASLLSGKYPGLVGVQGAIRRNPQNSWGYFNGDSLLSTHFQKANYTTALIGQWNLGMISPNLPNDKGFDLFIGYLGDQPEENGKESIIYYNDQKIESIGHPTDLFSNWAIDFINREADDKKPFFLLLAYNAPGTTLKPPSDWLTKVNNRQSYTNANRAQHVASIEQIDDRIGKIINSLKETSQYRNTIIVFSSDNGGFIPGGASNGIFRGGKYDLYEGGIRVPTCLLWRDKVKKGSLCHQISMTMDIFPTLCALSDTPNHLELDGKSLTNCIFKNEPFLKERTLFWVCRDGARSQGKPYYAARQGAYKLLQNSPDDDLQLFNLITDVHEQIPLRKSSEHYLRLKNLLIKHVRENERIHWKEIPVSTSVTPFVGNKK